MPRQPSLGGARPSRHKSSAEIFRLRLQQMPGPTNTPLDRVQAVVLAYESGLVSPGG